MCRVLFQVDVRRPAALLETLRQQQPRRIALGELGFALHVDDNARHVGYVALEWESVASAHRFLESAESKTLVNEWPIEEVFSAVALRDIARQVQGLGGSSDA